MRFPKYSHWLFVYFVVLGGCGGSNGAPASMDNDDAGSPVDDRPPPVDEGPPPDTLADCGTFVAGTDLAVCTATYLGSDGEDRLDSVAIAADGTVIVAGLLPGNDFAVNPTRLLGGGNGALLRLSPTGGEVLSVTRLPAEVTDMDISTSVNTIAVGGAFGILVLNTDANTIVWNQSTKAVKRLAAGSGGTVAVLAEKEITVFDSKGDLINTFVLDDSSVEDIAVYEIGEMVIVTGYNQVSANLQQPFLRAYDYSGNLMWTNYDWSAEEAGDLSSDTRGYAVTIGRDNQLYYAGESHGGVTTHFKDPRDLTVDAPIVRFDDYNQSHNWNGAAPLGFYARFDPFTGAMLLGQLVAPRLSTGKGNGASIHYIDANEDGTVIVGGQSACCIENSADKTINGIPAMPNYAGGGFVLVASGDMQTRHIWTTWSGTATGTVRGVAAWGSTMVVIQEHDADEESNQLENSLVISNALQRNAKGGLSEGHLSIWPSP